MLILYQLFSSTQRFKDLQQNIGGITPRMLTKELRILEKFNIVEKEVYREVPPRVEYSLTDDGVKLFPLIENIKRFGETFAYLLNEGDRPEGEVEKLWMAEEDKIEFELPKAEEIQNTIEDKAPILLNKIEEPVYKSIVENPVKTKSIKVEKLSEEAKKVVQLELF